MVQCPICIGTGQSVSIANHRVVDIACPVCMGKGVVRETVAAKIRDDRARRRMNYRLKSTNTQPGLDGLRAAAGKRKDEG